MYFTYFISLLLPHNVLLIFPHSFYVYCSLLCCAAINWWWSWRWCGWW